MVKTMEDITDIPEWWKQVQCGSFSELVDANKY